MRAAVTMILALVALGEGRAQVQPRVVDPSRPAAAPRDTTVGWSPARPRKGTLFRVVLREAGKGDRAAGELAGEPLHFAPDSAGRLSALAAVPIDAADTLRLELTLHRATGAKEILIRPVRVAEGNYPTERLRVAPRFGAEPDSATRRRTEEESRRAAEVSRAAHETPRLWRGAFVAPRPGRVTSGFGRARVFNGAVASRHMGTDFAGAVGAPVRAANRGVVRVVDDFFYGGNVVYLDHGEGLVTAYLHLSEQSVAVGDTVEKGQQIGRVGATGRVTGPHLHLIARYGNVTVDPGSLLAITRR